MTEQIPSSELAQELSPTSYWDNIMNNYNDPFLGMKNIAMTGLLIGMASENNLLEKDPQAYKEGLDLTLDAVENQDYTIRFCAIHILHNILEQTKDNIRYEEIFEVAKAAVLDHVKDENEWVRVVTKTTANKFFPTKKGLKKYLFKNI